MPRQAPLQHVTGLFSDLAQLAVQPVLQALLGVAARLELELARVELLNHVIAIGVTSLDQLLLGLFKLSEWGDVPDADRVSAVGDPAG